jgi:hypothetical protein
LRGELEKEKKGTKGTKGKLEQANAREEAASLPLSGKGPAHSVI